MVIVTAYCVRHCFKVWHQLFDGHLLHVNKSSRQAALPCALTCWRAFRLDMVTLCIIVFTSITINSISNEESSVKHARVVLHTALLLSWCRLLRTCFLHPGPPLLDGQNILFVFNVSRMSHQDPLPCAALVFKNRLLGLVNFLAGKMISFSQILIFSYPPCRLV